MHPLPDIKRRFLMYVAPPSKFKVRLTQGIQGLNYSGRVEVNYNNKGWGTICDTSFGSTDANVICIVLNFKGDVCAVSNAQLGKGSGKNCLSI